MEDKRFRVGVVNSVDGIQFIFVAEFVENVEIYHIAGYKNQWVVLKGGDHSVKLCAWIPEQAMELLKQLPNKPYDYQPFMQALSRS